MECCRDVILIARVGHVKIVGIGGELCSQSIDLLDAWQDAQGLSEGSDLIGAVLEWSEVGVSRNLFGEEQKEDNFSTRTIKDISYIISQYERANNFPSLT